MKVRSLNLNLPPGSWGGISRNWKSVGNLDSALLLQCHHPILRHCQCHHLFPTRELENFRQEARERNSFYLNSKSWTGACNPCEIDQILPRFSAWTLGSTWAKQCWITSQKLKTKLSLEPQLTKSQLGPAQLNLCLSLRKWHRALIIFCWFLVFIPIRKNLIYPV